MTEQPPPATPAPAQPPAAAPATPAPPAVHAGYAVKRPLGRVIGFTIITFGLYHFFWFYTVRKQLNEEMGSTDDAGLYTAGLLVPILNIFITYWLWRDLDLLRKRYGLPEIPVVLYLVLAAFVPFAAIVVYAMIVNRLNEYWDVRTGGQAVTAPITSGEKVVVGIGAAFFVLWGLIVVIVIVAAVVNS